ncbi:MAG: trypsin-like peptidase domain-containing protein [Vicinamibacterales bacterium]
MRGRLPVTLALLLALTLPAMPPALARDGVRAQDPADSTAEVDPRSLMTTPVWLLRDSQALSQGTGFLFASTTPDDEIATVFLVTNRHVVTGQPVLGAPTARDRIRIILHREPERPEDVQAVEFALYDAQGTPLWIASDRYPGADVVLVPLPRAAYEHLRLFVFTEAHTRGDIRIRPTSGATLLGYPYGFYDTTHFLPVWKTGHIASEPDVDFEGQPVFLVDVSAFPGMSGAPVLAVANGIYESTDGVMRSGRVLKLLGIFSATPVVREQRPAPAAASANGGPAPAPQTVETSLQLGYVWKASVITDLARRYEAGRRP